MRATPLEAAQDYCDYVNNVYTAQPPTLKTAGHKRPKRRKRPAAPVEVQDARKVIARHIAEVNANFPKQNHVYLIGMEGDRSAVKVGEAWDPADRAAALQTGNPYKLVVLGYFKVDASVKADSPYHQKLRAHHIQNEWFRPAREVLSLFGVSDATFFRKTRRSA